MKEVICSQEEAVARAARTGQWRESLTVHLAGCAVCQESVQVSRWMQTVGQHSNSNLVLPDADLLWWRARLSQKQREAEWAQKPLEVVEVFSQVIIAVGVAGWFAWNWSEFQQLWTGLLASLLPQLWRASWSVASWLPAFFMG